MSIQESLPSEASPGAVGFASPYSCYVLFMTFVALTLSYVDRVLVGVLAPAIKAELHLSDTSLGLLSGTAFAAVYCVAGVPVAWIADRFSRKWIIAGGLGVWSVATLVFGLGHRFQNLLLARMAVGFGETGAAAPSYSMLSFHFPDIQRARALAIMGFGQYFGVAGGAMLAGVAAASLGWRGTFWIAGAAGIVVLLLLMLTIRDSARPMSGAPDSSNANLAAIVTMCRQPAFLLLVAGAVLASMAKVPQQYWVPSYFTRSFGFTLAGAAFMFGTVNFAAGIAGIWLGGYLSDRMAVRSRSAYFFVPACLMVLCSVPLAGMFLTSSKPVAVACYFLEVVLSSGAFGPIMAATQLLAPTSLRATSASINSTLTIAIGMGAGVPLVGALSDLLKPVLGNEALRSALLVSLPCLSILAAGTWFAGSRLMNLQSTRVVTPSASN